MRTVKLKLSSPCSCLCFLYFSNSFSWIQPHGTGHCVVHDGVAVVQRRRPAAGQTLLHDADSRVNHPGIGLHKNHGFQMCVSILPAAPAAGAAAGTEDALVQPIQCLLTFCGLQIPLFAFLGFILLLQIRVNGFVLKIEVTQIRNEILHYTYMWQRVDF